MNRLIILTIIILISACQQQANKKESMKNDSVVQSPDLLAIENEKAQKSVNKSTTTDNQEQGVQLQFSNELSREKLTLSQKAVIIIQLDSIEIEQLKTIEGEDNFYTGADDLMWYNSMMLRKMDSLKIQVIYTDKDTVDLYSRKHNQTIVKDSTFSLYTYFYFDGNEIARTDLFELLDK